MIQYQIILAWLAATGAGVLAAAGVAVWCVERQVFPGRRLLGAFRRLPWFARVGLGAFVIQLIVYGSTKTNQTNGVEGGTTNAPPMMGASFVGPREHGPYEVALREPYGVATVADADIARGYRMIDVSTNAGYSFAMPSNGVLCGHWHQRGAFDDVTCVDFGDWTFPLGSNEVSRLWAFVGGFARPTIRDRAHEIAPVGASLSAIPSVSRLWMASTTNDVRLVTWENFAIGRIPKADYQLPSTNYHQFLNAQIELRPNGDFITRSNELATAYRRIDPNDWDGDGWHNDDDSDPKSWTGGEFGFEQSLPTNANSDAYCWIDVRAAYNTPVVFVGDGESNLPDPSFSARAGETNRVQLLIGKTYAVTSDQPLSVVARSSPDIEVDGDGTTELSIVYPVDISALEGNGNGFLMNVSPANLGGEFAWTRCCCPITGYGNHYWYAHTGHCTCDGCYAQGHYTYEGYSLDCEGGYCGCPYYCADDPYGTHEDDGPYAASVSASFSSPAVIFEDAYTNRPGVVVARQSTRTTLTCTAHGGEKGITASFSIVGGSKLVRVSGGTLPVTRFIPPQQKLEFEIEYEGCLPSESEKDIVVTATMTGEDVQPTTVTDELTSVRVELRVKNVAQSNPSENRHVYGVHEWVDFYRYPSSVSPALHIETAENDLIGADNEMFFCPWTNGVYNLRINVLGETFRTGMYVVEPEMVCRDVWWVDIGIVGLSGLLDMRLALYVEPTYVSFKNLNMVEIPDGIPCPRDGYFSTGSLEKTGSLSHTTSAGAGEWGAVKSDGSWKADRACRETAYPTPWSSGWKEWRIPVGWGDYLHNVKGRMDPNPTSQRFELDSDGTARVMKYNHEIERTPDNRVWLDGELRN